jgi:hypothetical protein
VEAVADTFKAGLDERRIAVADLGCVEGPLDLFTQLVVGEVGRA